MYISLYQYPMLVWCFKKKHQNTPQPSFSSWPQVDPGAPWLDKTEQEELKVMIKRSVNSIKKSRKIPLPKQIKHLGWGQVFGICCLFWYLPSSISLHTIPSSRKKKNRSEKGRCLWSDTSRHRCPLFVAACKRTIQGSSSQMYLFCNHLTLYSW